MRILDVDEVMRVVVYAYHNDYEPEECINLLNSKGQHKETYGSIEKLYRKLDSV